MNTEIGVANGGAPETQGEIPELSAEDTAQVDLGPRGTTAVLALKDRCFGYRRKEARHQEILTAQGKTGWRIEAEPDLPLLNQNAVGEDRSAHRRR
jgi:hypothetical protein